MPDLAQTTRLHVELLMASRSAELPADARELIAGMVKALPPGDEDLTAYRLRGLAISHPDWVWLNRIRAPVCQRWRNLFQDFDVVLCPPMPTPAFLHDHSPQRTRQVDIDGTLVSYNNQIVWASIATLAGLPATVAPIDRSETGLPIGVQIIGGYLEDRTTIGFADLLEREYGGFRLSPTI